MATSELLGALTRRKELAETQGSVFEASPQTSAADVAWDQRHASQFTPRGQHRLPVGRLPAEEDEESTGTITPPDERPPPGKVRAKASPADLARRISEELDLDTLKQRAQALQAPEPEPAAQVSAESSPTADPEALARQRAQAAASAVQAVAQACKALDPIQHTDEVPLGTSCEPELERRGEPKPKEEEMFGPFVQAAVDSLRRFVSDELGLEAFSWSLGIIAQMLVHTVTEGSTIVMKAINNNSTLQLASAVNSAPRGKRASWVLIVKVGTQDISPLRWAIESGSLSAAKAIIEDLLTIRADRERYYYGVDDLFARHRDIVQIICSEAPTLLTTFLEGLAWRSRTTDQGMRRVNYYVKNLFVDGNGNFAGALQALVGLGDPQIVSHSVVNVVSNHLWTGLVIQEFIVSKIWFIFSLVVLMVSQTLLPEYRESKEARIGTLFCRAITYMLTLLVLLIQHARDTFKAYYGRDTVRVLRLPVPRYLTQFYHIASLMLMICLVCMWIYEPYIHCVEDPEWPTEYCKGYDESGFIYSVFAMCAVGLHWGLMADLAVFSTGLSAFVLVCVHVGSEIGRFMFALLFLLTTFASAITVLEHGYEDMKQFGESMICLSGITLRLYEDDYRDLQNDPVLLTAVFGFITSSAILLLNLLIAQLNCSYVYVYQNMLGYAKLKRSSVSVQTLRYTKHERWTRFVATLGLDVPLEFNEGDVGMAGGIQVMEPQSLAVVAADRIQRFGGNCSPELEWPADTTIAVDEEEEKLAALEHLLHITLTKLRKGGGSTDKDSKEKHSFLSED
ncbi:unnamed protein product [Effrenium voratum]|uniref:Uncharacterized protein n=1 Tax=Effrenium voratum TaxID=2562239 RepID=A0AA36JNK7_9DINO|nr:unnamed protein product [Effrenium voratum]